MSAFSGCGSRTDDAIPKAAAQTDVGVFDVGASYELRTKAIVPADHEKHPEQGVIQVHVQYRNPEAGEVVLVWGLDKFTRRPPKLSPDTFLTFGDSHMNTPMQRDGDVFVADFETDAETLLQFQFNITRSSAGKRVDYWVSAGPDEPHFHKMLTVANADEKIVDPKIYIGKFGSDEWIMLHTKAIVPTDHEEHPKQGAIRVQMQYRNPEADEVVLVWGLDKFTRRPPKLSPDTFLTLGDSHMNTPMKRDGDIFVAELETDADTQLDFLFNITRNSSGENVDLWRNAGPNEPHFHKMLTVADADEKIVDPKIYIGKVGSDEWIELRTKVIARADRTNSSELPVIQAQLRYRNPTAGDVMLIWGFDKFTRIPAKLPPRTFLTLADSHLNTPMRRDGDMFVTEFETDADTRLDFLFNITRNSSGENVDLWLNAGPSDPHFHSMLTVADATEKSADAKSSADRFSFDEWSELTASEIKPSQAGADTTGLMKVQLKYRDPAAGDVVLVWGVDKFTKVPATLPPETSVTPENGRMNTTMRREGDCFVAELDVKTDATLDYAFNVTRNSAGEAVQLWKGAGAADGFYSRTITAALAKAGSVPMPEGEPRDTTPSKAPRLTGDESDELIKVFQKVVLPSKKVVRTEDRGIQVQVRYKNPLAEEVLLIWGFDNYKSKPQLLPPGTYLTYGDSHMNTPMTRKDDLFVVDFNVRKPTQLDYAFVITRTSDGQPAKIWRNDKSTGKDYKTMLSVENADEVIDPDANIPRSGGSWKMGIMIGVSALIAIWMIVDFRRGRKRKGPPPPNRA